MSVIQETFGYIGNDRRVSIYTLSNAAGVEIKITNFGGIITSVKTPDKNGNVENIVLGFDNLSDYREEHPCFGALIGRCANRIANARFDLDGNEYQLTANEGVHHLHGGRKGFDKVLWNAEELNNQSIRLSYHSTDGEEGYPGNLEVTVTYTLTSQNELQVQYEADTDKATPVNFTGHSYFNLNGLNGTILDHQLKLYANQYTPVNDQLIPTGEIKNVTGTPFNFSEFQSIGSRIHQVKGGYDHNYVLDNHTSELKIAAELYDPESHRKLTVSTTQPGIQLYTGNALDGSLVSPDGMLYKKHCGVCLEPQYFPNSPNEPDFPSVILRPGEKYQSAIVYSFSVE